MPTLMRIHLSFIGFPDDLPKTLPDIARKWITAANRRSDFGDGSIPENYNRPEQVRIDPFKKSSAMATPGDKASFLSTAKSTQL